MLPFALPIFPLPTVVLFPNVFLPLHIFEPRYRQMVAEALAGDRDELRNERKKLQLLLQPLFSEGLSNHLPDAMPDEDLINALAQYLEFEPMEKLALLEQPGALARCRAMMELLDVKELLEKSAADVGKVH